MHGWQSSNCNGLQIRKVVGANPTPCSIIELCESYIMFPLVLACDVTGKPHDWLSWESAVVAKVKNSISYEIGTSDIVARGGISRMTGTRSHVDVSSIICLKGHFKRKEKIVLNNHNLFRRDLHTCGYCGKEFHDHKLSRDHIIPRSKSGKDNWLNCITSCKKCNNMKDDQTPEEANMPLLFHPYVPNHCEELILKNRNILACQREFILAFLPQHSRLL